MSREYDPNWTPVQGCFTILALALLVVLVLRALI